MNERDQSPHPPRGRPKRPAGSGGALQTIPVNPRRARESLRADSERLAALVDAQQALAAADLDVHALVHLIVERVQQLTGAAGAAVALAEGDALVHGAAQGPLEGRPQMELSLLAEELGAGKMWRRDGPWFVPAGENGPTRPGAACSQIVLPLHHRGQLVGVLEVLAPLAHAFDDREIHTLQLLEGLLAAVLSHARDFEARLVLLDRRAAELRDSEERFESAFTFSAFGMACVAPGGRFLRVNPALCALFGYPAEELLRRDLHDLLHADDRALHRAYLERLLRGEVRNFQLEQRYQAGDGRTVWAILSLSAAREPAGGPRALIAQFQDLTAHRRLQERCAELQKMESLARLIGGFSPDAAAESGSRPARKRGRRSVLGTRPRQGCEWAFDGWYYRRGDAIVGPVPREEVRRLVEAGELHEAERVWERWKLGVESFLVPTTARAACVP